MTRAYFTENEKMYTPKFPAWSMDAKLHIEEILQDKGYPVSVVARVGCDRKYHDAWQVEREDIPRLVEQLFRQRIAVEVQAEGHGKASINFVYDYSESQILAAVSRFRRNRK